MAVNFDEEWLGKQRRALASRVEEVLRYLENEDILKECKHAWLYTEVGEIEYAQFAGILEDAHAERYKDRLFAAWDKATLKEAI